jgi:hypothetical protein
MCVLPYWVWLVISNAFDDKVLPFCDDTTVEEFFQQLITLLYEASHLFLLWGYCLSNWGALQKILYLCYAHAPGGY